MRSHEMSGIYTVKRLSPLRKVIAARMTEATQIIPHFHVVADIELDRLLALRAQMNDSQRDIKVTVNDCMIKACAMALLRHPGVNVQLVGEEIREYRQADISVVIAIDGGLSTPVVRAADTKSVQDIAAEVKALVARAAAGQLRMSEIVGGSFSISSLGAYDVVQFDAIINPPQCAILAVGRAKPRMVVTDGNETRIATILRATLSADHRAIDGVAAAEFLATLTQVVETPDDLFGARLD